MGEVWRGGATSQYSHQVTEILYIEGQRVEIPRSPFIFYGERYGGDSKIGVTISSTIASAGGGDTHVTMWLDGSDFPALIRAMLKADPKAASDAFDAAVAASL